MDEIIEKYIAADSQSQHGKPCFRGTRIPVYVLLELLERGVRPEEIVGKNYYPNLTLEHVRAALHFAAEAAKNQEYYPFPKSN